MGHGVVLLKLPQYMAVGIAGDELFTGTYYLHNGTRYYYQETTAKGWGIGDLPEDLPVLRLRCSRWNNGR